MNALISCYFYCKTIMSGIIHYAFQCSPGKKTTVLRKSVISLKNWEASFYQKITAACFLWLPGNSEQSLMLNRCNS